MTFFGESGIPKLNHILGEGQIRNIPQTVFGRIYIYNLKHLTVMCLLKNGPPKHTCDFFPGFETPEFATRPTSSSSEVRCSAQGPVLSMAARVVAHVAMSRWSSGSSDDQSE